ncbi:MAG TPA: hypothetical protein VMV31_02680 [Terriglobales bacterium]|nr:hypothetical protein [Terriglobales bacterium]
MTQSLAPAPRRLGRGRCGRGFLCAVAAVLAVGLARPGAARAQTDEIQVYDASIAPQGKFNLTLHNNFTPDGATVPVFSGALVSNHSLNGTAEWAYGAKDWLELGLYLPLYSISSNRGGTINGGKLRVLFVSPHADERTFFYGMNFEFSYNALHWDPRHYTSEIRPIFGWHLHPWDFIFNPILDNSWRGGLKSLDFAPSTRIAYNLNRRWALAGEEYSDIGELRSFLPAAQQWQQAWAVVDHYSKAVDIEAGIGFGLNAASDKVTLKLMFSRDLN